MPRKKKEEVAPQDTQEQKDAFVEEVKDKAIQAPHLTNDPLPGVKLETRAGMVSVQMTEEEKDEFVKFKADQGKKKTEENVADPSASKVLYQMNLGFRHNINGNPFGPGPAQVPAEWVGLVQQGEQLQLQQELNRNLSREQTFKVLQSGQAIPVRAQ